MFNTKPVVVNVLEVHLWQGDGIVGHPEMC